MSVHFRLLLFGVKETFGLNFTLFSVLCNNDIIGKILPKLLSLH